MLPNAMGIAGVDLHYEQLELELHATQFDTIEEMGRYGRGRSRRRTASRESTSKKQHWIRKTKQI